MCDGPIKNTSQLKWDERNIDLCIILYNFKYYSHISTYKFIYSRALPYTNIMKNQS